ncbi:hypothetical protein [Dictyobacter formicarum]|uniref:TIR domain-containing protein n=1 Tax=Dictyobacter formicarum TaxID=2778368 RepID=A0ABQ3VIM3_9CHLR|nr:hypothetical protein [Dictyobacter formicarum]GHO85915.1 hypothetical protein KSZ_39210 [Dictyobacter formicarum]
MGYEMQPSFLRRRVLVAVAPDDMQAIELVKAMRALGLTVIIAATIGLASQADDVAVCVVVLHPDRWRSVPSVMTAMRRNPRFMIPVLEEPMSLPRAAWATEPFYLAEEMLAETAKALVTLIRHHLQTVSEQEVNVLMQERAGSNPWLRELEESASAAWLREPEIVSSAPAHKKRPGSNLAHYIQLCWPLAFILCISFLTYYFFQLSVTTNTEATTPMATTSTWRNHVYSTIVPGQECDTGGADWEVPDYYKGIATPTASDPVTATPRQSTPTPQLILDNSIVTTCQQDGVLLTHTSHYAAFASMIFTSRGLPLPHHYSTQIMASVVNTSKAAVFKLGVRDQSGSDMSGTELGYGNDVLQVGINGAWEIVRYNNTTNAIDVRYARGFVPAAQNYILAADVNGPAMTFTINQHTVATIIDTTYPDSYGISFGLSDAGAKEPPSALFSHFTYTPLPDSLPKNDAEVRSTAYAQANAAANQLRRQSYSALVPGFACDHGQGQWQPTSEIEGYITTHCLAQGLSVEQKAHIKNMGRIPFYGLDGFVYGNYCVKVDVDLKRSNDNWAGLSTRINTQGASYTFLIRNDGNWKIVRYDNNGAGYQLAAGRVAPRDSYTLEAESNVDNQSLQIDSVPVASVHDVFLNTTDHIELNTLPGSKGAAATTIFSNFTFTPLP